jgi:fumarate reductase subunit C
MLFKAMDWFSKVPKVLQGILGENGFENSFIYQKLWDLVFLATIVAGF